MSKAWSVRFVNKKAESEILDLSPRLKAKFLHVIGLLNEFGPRNIGMPHARFLGDKLWELRLKDKDNIARSIYVLADRQRIFILHTFIKKTQKTPANTMKIARERIREIPND